VISPVPRYEVAPLQNSGFFKNSNPLIFNEETSFEVHVLAKMVFDNLDTEGLIA